MKLALRQAAAASTPLGYLPEQIDPASSSPTWVVPLAWSHAFFLQLSNRTRLAEVRQKNLE
jgi:GH15 family glucan-1,4-alpha-glucosidase